MDTLEKELTEVEKVINEYTAFNSPEDDTFQQLLRLNQYASSSVDLHKKHQAKRLSMSALFTQISNVLTNYQ